MKQLPSTNWKEIDRLADEKKKVIDYMAEHPLTHDKAVEQVNRLKELLSKQHDI